MENVCENQDLASKTHRELGRSSSPQMGAGLVTLQNSEQMKLLSMKEFHHRRQKPFSSSSQKHFLRSFTNKTSIKAGSKSKKWGIRWTSSDNSDILVEEILVRNSVGLPSPKNEAFVVGVWKEYEECEEY